MKDLTIGIIYCPGEWTIFPWITTYKNGTEFSWIFFEIFYGILEDDDDDEDDLGDEFYV